MNRGGWGANAPVPPRSRRDDDASRHLPCPYRSVEALPSFSQSYQPRLFNYEDGPPLAGVSIASADGDQGKGQEGRGNRRAP